MNKNTAITWLPEDINDSLIVLESELSDLRWLVCDKVNEITKASRARHSTDWIDVDYLSWLEKIYLSDEDFENYRKTQAIRFAPHYIEIAWLKVSRLNFVPNGSSKKDKNIADKQFLTYEQLWKYFVLNTGLNIPTVKQWSYILESMPGDDNIEKKNNLKHILNISDTWYYSFTWKYQWEWAYYFAMNEETNLLNVFEVDDLKFIPIYTSNAYINNRFTTRFILK